MVFESLVADLLNRFLGDFVDNLDASQLNIGIWGGWFITPTFHSFRFHRAQVFISSAFHCP